MLNGELGGERVKRALVTDTHSRGGEFKTLSYHQYIDFSTNVTRPFPGEGWVEEVITQNQSTHSFARRSDRGVIIDDIFYMPGQSSALLKLQLVGISCSPESRHCAI